MNNIKSIFSDKNRIMLLAAFVLGVISFVLYLVAGPTFFDPNYSVMAILGYSFATVVCAVIVFKPSRVLAFIAYLLYLFTFLEYVITQVNYLANIIYGVDGNTLSFVFFATVISSALAFILSLVAGICMKSSKKTADVASKRS